MSLQIYVGQDVKRKNEKSKAKVIELFVQQDLIIYIKRSEHY